MKSIFQRRRTWHRKQRHEDRFYNRTVLARFDLFDVRTKRVPSLYSHAAAYGRCSAVLRSPLRVPVLRGDFSVADSARGPVACESLRAFGIDDSGGRDCQHTCFHIFMAPAGLPPAVVVTVLWFLTTWRVRSAFTGILQR
jgi:hypothetical protein